MKKIEQAQQAKIENHIAASAPDLFDLIPPHQKRQKGIEKTWTATLSWDPTKTNKITYHIFYQLSEEDRDIFLAVLYLVSKRQRRVKQKASDMLLPDIPGNTEQNIAVKSFCIETTIYELLDLAGKRKNGTENYKSVKNSLRRLSLVGYIAEIWRKTGYKTKIPGKKKADKFIFGGYRLLQFGYDETNKKLIIKIDPLTATIYRFDAYYVSVDIGDRRELKSNAAKATHFYLSTLIRPGATKKINLTTIAKRIYHVDKPGRMQLLRTKNAVAAINKLSSSSWKIKIDTEKNLIIKRKRTKKLK